MFDFGNANDGQRQAISTTEGPVLITAGPGTGKTYTLVQRAIYLIEERGVKPEDIFIATFTEKAAKELITRITNELASRNITVNVNEMYVGTFHSLCLRIIKDHLEYTRLKKNYRLLDTFDQQYLVFRNIYKFRTISGIENVMPKGGAWKWAQAICEFSNNLTEEVVDIDAMLSDHDMEISVIVESIMIDWNYDGVVMQPMVTDVPDKKEFVAGIYDIPEDAGTIKVKITDLLSESLEVEV